MDKKVTITNSQGQTAVANIVKVFRLNDMNSDYVIYTFNQKDPANNIKNYVSKLRVENNSYYFDTINDDAEWEKVSSAIGVMGKGGE